MNDKGALVGLIFSKNLNLENCARLCKGGLINQLSMCNIDEYVC